MSEPHRPRARRAGVLAAVAIGAAVAATGGAAAFADSPAVAAPHALAAASTTLTAVVDGTSNNTSALLVHGSGPLSASLVSGDLTHGTHEVILDRNVSQCTYSATISGKPPMSRSRDSSPSPVAAASPTACSS
jgi:hypothetical protein